MTGCRPWFSVVISSGVEIVELCEWVLVKESSSNETICDGNVMGCESSSFKVKGKMVSWKLTSRLTKFV